MVNICKHNKLTEKRKLSYVDFLCVLNNMVPSKSWFLHLFKVEMTILCRKADKSKPNIYLKYAFKLIFNQICMGCRFTFYSLFMDIQNSFLDIHN